MEIAMSTKTEATTAAPAFPDHKPIDIGDGMILLVGKDEQCTEPEDLAVRVGMLLRYMQIGREAAIARIKEVITELARIDEERGGDEPELAYLCDTMGWMSNFTTHTTEDYRKVMLVIADVLPEDDIASVLDSAEEYLRLATERSAA